MQRIELNVLRIINRRSLNFAKRRPQNIHAWNNAELRDQREREHQAEQHVPRCKHMRGAVGKAAVKQGTDQIDEPRKNSNPMQLAQSSSNDVARKMSSWQNGECRRRQHKCKK